MPLIFWILRLHQLPVSQQLYLRPDGINFFAHQLLAGRIRPRSARPLVGRQGEREHGRLGVKVGLRRGRDDVYRAAVGRRQQGGAAVTAPVLLAEQLEVRRPGRLVGEGEVRPHARGRADPPFVVDRERQLGALAAHAHVSVDFKPRLERSARRHRRPGDRAGSQNLLCRKFHANSIAYPPRWDMAYFSAT